MTTFGSLPNHHVRCHLSFPLVFSDDWLCPPNELKCGSGTPVCISPHVICDGVDDCSDGKDEESKLCGKFFEEAHFSLLHLGDIINLGS